MATVHEDSKGLCHQIKLWLNNITEIVVQEHNMEISGKLTKNFGIEDGIIISLQWHSKIAQFLLVAKLLETPIWSLSSPDNWSSNRDWQRNIKCELDNLFMIKIEI